MCYSFHYDVTNSIIVLGVRLNIIQDEFDKEQESSVLTLHYGTQSPVIVIRIMQKRLPRE